VCCQPEYTVKYVELTPSVAFDTAFVALSSSNSSVEGAIVAFEDPRGNECVGREIVRAAATSITDVAAA